MNMDLMLNRYYQKAIICPSLRIMVVLCHSSPSMQDIGGWTHLLFARPGDRTCTPLNTFGYCLISDLLFHNGKLFVVDFIGRLATFNLDHPSNSPHALIHGCDGINTSSIIYLAESPSGDDLLLVLKHWDVTRMRRKHSTIVFKWPEDDGTEWLEVNNSSVGELLLFLGSNGSMAFSCSDLSGRRNNLVCYAKDLKALDPCCADAGKFNCLNFDQPRRIWFSPDLGDNK